MARSFFERLTGSVRVNEETDDVRLRRSSATPLYPRTPPAARRQEREAGEPQNVIHPTAFDDGRSRAAAVSQSEPEEEGQLTLDIYDDGANIVIQSMVAGVKPEDIDISLEDNTLTIRGERKRAQEVADDSFYYRELYWGAFSRSIILPEEVDFPKADAVIRNGLLTVKLPKKEKGARKIRVKGAE